jgi:hypothetical protein
VQHGGRDGGDLEVPFIVRGRGRRAKYDRRLESEVDVRIVGSADAAAGSGKAGGGGSIPAGSVP